MRLSAEYRLIVPRATWMAARARNALHRPIFIGAVSVGTFVTALVALVVVPQQAQRKAQAIAPKPGERPDTVSLVHAVAVADARVASSEAALLTARTKAVMLAQTAVDSLDPILVARRDSLGKRLADLDQLLTRTETAPLTASYRALAESPEVAGQAGVKVLVDSLADIERERDATGTSGGADPVFVALTARATEIGRSLQAIGRARREAIRAQIAALAPPARPSPGELAQADTVRRVAARDSALNSLALATTQLANARRVMQDLDRRAERARELANPLSAPPYAMLASAI